ncbi:hypothetical protein Bca52824_078271 [Brassica carinata]|uniref:Uncharacterized protein n=1 Tax=Brassica carinata TaxID=52824 RepID=A0A8X7TYC5_BRACI|nr:hypothetical protein Bca52824_078271 [Brassica carinata]
MVMEEGRQKDLQLLEEIIDKGLTHKLLQTIASRDKIFEDQKAMFEPDMLAFSGCYYGGGDKERRELASIRRRWKTLHVMPTLHTLREWLH